jgi:hypothetical protein
MKHLKPNKYLLIVLISLLFNTLRTYSEPAKDQVAALVNQQTYTTLRAEIEQFKSDVEARFPVQLNIVKGDWTRPEEVRKLIRDLYRKKTIGGVVLVGAIPMHRFYMHDFANPNPLYFEDFDLEFGDSNGDGIDDFYKGTPDLKVWVANLRGVENPKDQGIEVLRAFFNKSHAYYTGKQNIERRALAVTGKDWPGGASWFSGFMGETVFGKENVDTLGSEQVTSTSVLDAFRKHTYTMFYIQVHSSATEQRMEKVSVSSAEIAEIATGSLFTVNHGCSTGNWLKADVKKERNTAMSWVFGKGIGQAVVANVRTGMVYGQESLYRRILEGDYLGPAYLSCKRAGEQEMHKEFPNGEIVSGVTFIGNPFIYIHPKSVSWPVVQHPETRPWTWWWWHGAAADKENITQELEAFQKAGFGGVNVVCPLSVKDDNAPKVKFLSKEYADLIAHTVGEARRLGMDADIAPVSGWAFGGPAVSKDKSCALVALKKFSESHISGKKSIFGSAPGDEFRFENLESVLAVSEDGQRITVTDKTKADGTIEWEMPSGNWTFYVTCLQPGSSKVRFPSPDQVGFVVDHLKKDAVMEYLSQFNRAFADIPKENLPRAYNVDSWEIKLDWTKGYFNEFRKRRGYDLQLHIPELFQYGDSTMEKRVICDYRETLSDLLIENFNKPFDSWAGGLGGQSIAEILSEPSNILDANATVDIPQMDIGSPLARYVRDGRFIFPEYDEKCAASVAHILGKPYISSETFTCMGPVLNTPLEMCKEKLDYDFFAGVNQTCFHGITYSPMSAHWPGWLFYAGTHLGEFNPQWQQTSQLCTYITRTQSFLQKGRHDADLLFYLPYYDIFSRIDSDPGQAPRWWGYIPAENYPTAGKLTSGGCDFDLFSDKMLTGSFRTQNGSVITPGNRYRAIVIADCLRIPVETLEKVLELAKEGAKVLMIGPLPSDVPGFFKLNERKEKLSRLLNGLRSKTKVINPDISLARVGSGEVIFGADVLKVIEYAGIQRETMIDQGLQFSRRRDQDGWIYFIANPAQNQAVQGWVPLGVAGRSAALFDAMSGRTGMAAYRVKNNGSEVYIQLDPRESIVVKVFDDVATGNDWNYPVAEGYPVPISGTWRVSFLSGGEIIPHPETINGLSSWTLWPSDQGQALKGFAGVARYEITFQKPTVDADEFRLSLGEVCHTARVILNGNRLGDLISRPMRVDCGAFLKEGSNTLVVEVANTPINRIADLEIRGIDWYYQTPGMDLSSCEWDYAKKDSTWIPQPSGLLGPVELIPVRFKKIK